MQQYILLIVFATACLAPVALFPAVQSTPLEFNPRPIGNDIVSLTHSHPAFGAGLTSSENTAYEDRTYPDISGEDRDLDSEEEAVSAALAAVRIVSGSTSPPVTSTATNVDNSTITFESGQIGNGANVSNETGTVLAYVRRLETTSTDVQRLEEFFKTSMERNVNKLGKKGSAPQMPWPSSYWPIYLDGINYQWNPNQASPAAKYASAFGLDVKEFTAKISQTSGVLSQSTATACYSNLQCAGLRDGSACAKRSGESQGFCIPTWFGICHAWTPAAILESEPGCAVTKNGVTFQPMDIKALLTQVYDGASLSTVFTGVRFNGNDNTAKKDKYGRYTDSSRRDLGPGFLHLALGNILGKLQKTFILDVTGGAEVWNQPVYSYEVLRQTELTTKQGAQQFFGTSRYPFNNNANSLMYVQTKVTWMVEALEDGALVKNGRAAAYTNSDTYTYVLELDASKNILGGEWVGKSADDHPDFLWFPTGKPADSTVTNVGLSYANVKALLAESLKC